MIRFVIRLFWILLGLLLIRIIFRALAGKKRSTQAPGRPAPGPDRSPVKPETMLQDPVCGMYLDPSLALPLKQGGQTLHFCSPECLNQYRERESRS